MIDSYFGLIGNSFYAGPNGASFQIKYIFPNKVELDQDIENGINSSPVQVGDYVIISYGDKNQPEYQENRELDSPSYWNATLWQKMYGKPTQDSSTDEVYYKNIVTFSSAEPTLSLELDTTNSHADTIPSIELDAESTAFDQKYIAQLPTSWDMRIGTYQTVSPAGALEININRDQNNADSSDEESSSNHDIKYIHFKIPNAWNINANSIVLPPQRNPSLTTTENETTKTFTFGIPQSWDIELGQQEISSPSEDPSVKISYSPTDSTMDEPETDSTTKYLWFNLPKVWNIELNDTQLINPAESPSVSIDTTNTSKILQFNLPKPWNIDVGTVTQSAVDSIPTIVVNNIDRNGIESDTFKYAHFTLPVNQSFQRNAFTVNLIGPTESPTANISYDISDTLKQFPKVALSLPAAIKTKYGGALAQTNNATVSSSSAEYSEINSLSIGDYYINTSLGAIHRISSINANNIQTTYAGSIQLPLPTIVSSIVNPYTANGDPILPSIEMPVTTGPVSNWQVQVNMPKPPIFMKHTDSRFIGSTETGDISCQVQNDTVYFRFLIPRGTKITTSTTIANKDDSTFKTNCLKGDLYLDSLGQLYIFDGNNLDGTWILGSSLKGKNLAVKNASAISISALELNNIDAPNLYAKMGKFIENNYSQYSTNLQSNEVINIVYTTNEGLVLSYWLYKAPNENGTMSWTGSQLTGDASNSIIVNDTTVTEDDSKAYSVTAMHNIINNLQQQVNILQAEVNRAWGKISQMNN